VVVQNQVQVHHHQVGRAVEQVIKKGNCQQRLQTHDHPKAHDPKQLASLHRHPRRQSPITANPAAKPDELAAPPHAAIAVNPF